MIYLQCGKARSAAHSLFPSADLVRDRSSPMLPDVFACLALLATRGGDGVGDGVVAGGGFGHGIGVGDGVVALGVVGVVVGVGGVGAVGVGVGGRWCRGRCGGWWRFWRWCR